MSELAAGLNTAVVELRHSVIHAVRTSTTEMDRRREDRFPVHLNCRLSIGGQSSTARVIDLSQHGARIFGAPSVPVGTRGSLTVDGVDFVLPFTVRAVADDRLHLMFELDEATAARFSAVPASLATRRAA